MKRLLMLTLTLTLFTACGSEEGVDPTATQQGDASGIAPTQTASLAEPLVVLTWPEDKRSFVPTTIDSSTTPTPNTPQIGSVLTASLVVENGCLRLPLEGDSSIGEGGTQEHVTALNLIWPPGFDVETVGHEVQVHDADGTTIAKVGDEIRVVGMNLAAGTDLSGFTGQPEAEHCAEPPAYFLVGDVPTAS